MSVLINGDLKITTTFIFVPCGSVSDFQYYFDILQFFCNFKFDHIWDLTFMILVLRYSFR
jgi:hypothetical protein